MRRYHQIADRLIAELLSYLPDGKEIIQALGHFPVVHIDIAVMHPVMGKGYSIAALALGNFIFVMGKNQILTAAMDIDGISQIGSGHGRAFDMPSRPPLSPWGIPIRLAWLGRFPKGEVHRVFLALSNPDAGAGLQLLQRLMGKLSIPAEL